MSKKSFKGSKFAKFSGLSVQMIILIGGGAWGGNYLDQKMQNEKPIFTIIFSLIGIGASLYFVIREAGKLADDE